jgi:hypothetical protein
MPGYDEQEDVLPNVSMSELTEIQRALHSRLNFLETTSNSDMKSLYPLLKKVSKILSELQIESSRGNIKFVNPPK